MGTRSDFYVGIGKTAEWIGSIAYDGFPEAISSYGIFEAADEEVYRSLVAALAERDDFTSPEQGWPWPWPDSLKSDFAYAFHQDRVVFGSGYDDFGWTDASGYVRDKVSPDPRMTNRAGIAGFEFPDMRDRRIVALDGRSGFMMIGLSS